MHTRLQKNLLLVMLLQGISSAAFAASAIAIRLDDPKAVYLTAPDFGAHADGMSDDSAALQAAIDKTGNNAPEGIVFVAPGRYRLTRTVYVRPGMRIFGYGATRPVFVLAANTPGFQKGVGVMVMFTGARAGRGGGRGFRVPFPPPDSVPPNDAIADAGPGTFYTAMGRAH